MDLLDKLLPILVGVGGIILAVLQVRVKSSDIDVRIKEAQLASAKSNQVELDKLREELRHERDTSRQREEADRAQLQAALSQVSQLQSDNQVLMQRYSNLNAAHLDATVQLQRLVNLEPRIEANERYIKELRDQLAEKDQKIVQLIQAHDADRKAWQAERDQYEARINDLIANKDQQIEKLRTDLAAREAERDRLRDEMQARINELVSEVAGLRNQLAIRQDSQAREELASSIKRATQEVRGIDVTGKQQGGIDGAAQPAQ